MTDGLESVLLTSQVEKVGSLKDRIWTEAKLVWKTAFPSILSRVTSFGISLVTQSFVGHTNKVDLAAYGLVQLILVRFTTGILTGMSSATETLCGQAFGAKQYHMMGIYLQRSWLIEIAIAAIFLPFYTFATPIFKLIGQDDDISEAAGTLAKWFISSIISYIFMMTIQMFLQAQRKNKIIGWLSTSSFALNVLLSWVFVYKFGWGVSGAMAAMVSSYWLLVFAEFIYIIGGWCPDTWNGFSKAAFTDLVPVVKLSVSSGIMLCVQMWYNCVLVLLAGYSKDATVSISAFSICLNISNLVYTLYLGFLGASCVRVSNEIGRGNAEAAKFAAKLIMCTSFSFGLLFWILCLIYGEQIPYLFTNDKGVAEAAGDLSVFLAFTVLVQSIQPVLSGVAIGCGLQGKVAVVNICCYYLVGIPIGVLLAYLADLQTKGIWIGMLCGLLMQASVLSYLTCKIDWDDEVNKASARLNRFLVKLSEESEEISN